MEKLSDKNPCNVCAADRQTGNPYRHQCECDRCLKPGRWKDECIKKLKEYEDLEQECIERTHFCLALLIDKRGEFYEDIEELGRYRKPEGQMRPKAEGGSYE